MFRFIHTRTGEIQTNWKIESCLNSHAHSKSNKTKRKRREANNNKFVQKLLIVLGPSHTIAKSNLFPMIVCFIQTLTCNTLRQREPTKCNEIITNADKYHFIFITRFSLLLLPNREFVFVCVCVYLCTWIGSLNKRRFETVWYTIRCRRRSDDFKQKICLLEMNAC